MHGMKVADGFLQSQKVSGREITADIHVHGDQCAAVGDCSVSANNHEIHPMADQSFQQAGKLTHGVFACLP